MKAKVGVAEVVREYDDHIGPRSSKTHLQISKAQACLHEGRARLFASIREDAFRRPALGAAVNLAMLVPLVLKTSIALNVFCLGLESTASDINYFTHACAGWFPATLPLCRIVNA